LVGISGRLNRGFVLKKVLVVVNASVVIEGIESILSRETDLLVLSTVFVDQESLYHKVKEHRPDAIVIEQGLLFSGQINLLTLLTSSKRVRILVLNVRDNDVNIYDHNATPIFHSSDLISSIRTF
jgi:DNA-binding NarL/FixJ family response regulator